MITPEERQEIIDAAVEKALLVLPEVVGTLMVNHAAMLDINKKFYSDHPDFVTHQTVVRSVVEQLEAQRPGIDYKDLLKDAVPIIRERIALQSGLNMDTVKRPDRHMPHLVPSAEIHTDQPYGEL